MNDSEARSLEQIRAFLANSEEWQFEGQKRTERYRWIEETLKRMDYAGLKRADKGVVRQYVGRLTGMSRAQVTRLVAAYVKTGKVEAAPYQRRKFPQRYTDTDIRLLARVDKAHENLSGPATKHILEREYQEYEQGAFERLASISVAQLYRLRERATYRKHNTTYEPTRPAVIAIGERRKPNPEGRPGYLRVDTVHQGDRDGEKGLYHVNAVDEVTQWEVVAAVAHISEQWLTPVLEQLLEQFPFRLRGFHSDNGSEYINHTVASLLDKLWIEQTKSRPYRSGDNGLVEAKNGAVIRKHVGFGHICAEHAEVMNTFHREYLNRM